MKWEEVQKQRPETSKYTKTDIECPKCGKKIFKRVDIIVLSSYSAPYSEQYQYECKCGWVGYAYV